MNKNKNHEKYDNLMAAAEVFKDAKRDTIALFGRIARKNRILVYPMFLLTVLFIFIYNILLYTGIKLKMREKIARAVAVILVCSLVLTSADILAFALHKDWKGAYTITETEELSEEIANQKLPMGSSEEDIVFPEVLAVTIQYEKEVVTENPTEEEPEEEEPTDESPADEEPAEEEPADEEPAEEDPASGEPSEEPGEAEDPEEEIPSEEPEITAPTEEEEIETSEEEEIPEETEIPEENVIPNESGEEIQGQEEVSKDTLSHNSIVKEFFDTFKPLSAYAEELEEKDEDEEIVTELVTVYSEILVPVEWKRNEEESADGKISKAKAGDVFVYYPEFPEEYSVAEDVILPVITVTIVPYTQILEAQSGDILITLKAMAGVFPKDAVLSCEAIVDEDTIEKIDELVVDDKDSDVVKKTIAFDIKVFDKDGEEVQPEIPEGTDAGEVISLTFNKIVPALSENVKEEENDVIQAFTVNDEITDITKIDSDTDDSDVTIYPEHFTIYGVTLTGDAALPVTIGNGGYPYGTAMTSSSITLNVSLSSGTATSYQWQSSTDKSSWTNIAGKTAATAAVTPSSGTWYRCVVNGTNSKAVQAVLPSSDSRNWTGPYNSWYLSNGSMAYMYNGSVFDVTGLYEKNNKKYMLQTSFGYCWTINGAVSSFTVSFDESNAFSVVFTAVLSGTQFGFDCDTQLGDYQTSGGYSDSAALIAYLNSDKSLKQVAMMGAASEEAALDSDPAFVIVPLTGGSKFWLGKYSGRSKWGYNTLGGSGLTTTSIGGQNVVVACEGIDSGMSMSWQGLSAGSTVSFSFGVGSVANTGAKKAEVVPTSTSIKIPETDSDCYYAIFKKGETTPVIEWVRGNGSELVFDDLESNTEYVVKVITKEAYESGQFDDSEDTEAKTAIDPLCPETPENPEEEIVLPEFTIKSRSITIEKLNRTYTYNLVDVNDNYIYSSFKSTDADGKLVFEGLNPAVTYYLVAKTPQNNFTDKVEKKTLPCVSFNVKGHGTAPGVIYDVEFDSVINAPVAPSENGWGFMGWYKTTACNDADLWDFETDTVSDNITLYAKWAPHTHTWVYVQQSTELLLAYCSTDDVTGHCTYYCEGPGGANAVKVKISAEDAAYTGEAYAGLNILDTLVAADSVNNERLETEFYTDASFTTKTTVENDGALLPGSAPVNVGTYYAKIVINGQNENSFVLKTSFEITVASIKNMGLVIEPATYVATGLPINAEYVVKDGNRVLTKDVDYEVTEESVVSATDVGTYTISVKGINNYVGTVTKTWKITDATPPEGVVSVSGMADSSDFVSKTDISFGNYFNSARTITINASDLENDASDLSVSYYLTNLATDESSLHGHVSWTSIANGGSFTVTKDGEYVVYVKIQDPSGNISYISSQGFCIDKIDPVISGIKNGSKFCKDADFRVIDKGAGIASVLIDGIEVFVEGIYDYTLTGEDSADKHSVVVTDKAGNSVTVSDISLNVESEHEWKAEVTIKEPTCTVKGEKTRTCSKCGTMKHFDIDALGHDFDFSAEASDSWDMVWTLKKIGDENVYYGTAYLYCARGCKAKLAVEDTVSESILLEAERTETDDENIKYEITLHYMDGDTPKTRVFTKYAKKNLLSEEIIAGDNTLSTEVICAEDAPQISIEGLDEENALGLLTQGEKSKLEDSESGFTTKITVFLEVQNVDGTVSAEEENGLKSEIASALGNEPADVTLLDLSLYKQTVTQKSDGTGTALKKTEKLNSASKSIGISISVEGLGFADVAKGYKRIYAVSRNHDYSSAQDGSDIRNEVIFEGEASDGKIVLDSELFCTYAIGYKDVKAKKTTPKTEPKDEPQDEPKDEPLEEEIPEEKNIVKQDPVTPPKNNKGSKTSITDTEISETEIVEEEILKDDVTDIPSVDADEEIKTVEEEAVKEMPETVTSDSADNQDVPDVTKENDCYMHWFHILLLGLYALASVLVRKKSSKVKLAVTAVNCISAIVLLVTGSCGLDLVFFIAELAATVGIAWLFWEKAKKKIKPLK